MTRRMPLASTPRREAATLEGDLAAYPTLSDHAAARRRFLKLCALSGVAASLGLQLTGCPNSGGGGGGGGKPDWIPWDDDIPQVAGGMRPMPMGKPVAVVVGGGPIAVTFKDGANASLVVAGILTPAPGINAIKDCSTQKTAHATLVQEQAALHPSSILQDAAALKALEDGIRNGINGTLPQGYITDVSVGEAKKPKKARDRSNAASDSASRRSAKSEPAAMAPAAPSPAASADAGAGAPAPSKPAPARPAQARAKFTEIWAPCRRPGCTTCG